MTMIRRRLMLAIGAALMVGGWGATRRYAVQQQRVIRLVGMAVGAGLIGFAFLRHTTRKDE